MLVRESLYNFKREIDPIQSSGLGVKTKIEEWLFNYKIHDYHINDDYTIDVFDNVGLYGENLSNFPDYIKFRNIKGDFEISDNKFVNFKNFPTYISNDFLFSRNCIKSINGFPSYIGGNVYFVKMNLNDKELLNLISSIEKLKHDEKTIIKGKMIF